MAVQTLEVTFQDGTTKALQVECGSSNNARRLPARIGRALMTGTATAVLLYDGVERTAIQKSGRFYMRQKKGRYAQ